MGTALIPTIGAISTVDIPPSSKRTKTVRRSIGIASIRIVLFSSTTSRRTSTRRDVLGFTASNSSTRRRCARNSSD